MKKVLMIGLMALAVTITGTMTAQAAKHKAKAAAALQEISAVGTVEQNGKHIELTDADGTKVYLPKGDASQYVGTKVKVTGQGTTTTNKKGITVKHIKTVTKIEKADAAQATPATPVTPAPSVPATPAK